MGAGGRFDRLTTPQQRSLTTTVIAANWAESHVDCGGNVIVASEVSLGARGTALQAEPADGVGNSQSTRRRADAKETKRTGAWARAAPRRAERARRRRAGPPIVVQASNKKPGADGEASSCAPVSAAQRGDCVQIQCMIQVFERFTRLWLKLMVLMVFGVRLRRGCSRRG